MSDYGSVAGVAAFVRYMTFDAANNPTTAEVESYLVQQSSKLNGWLARANYATPVTSSNANAKAVLDNFANLGAAGLAEMTQRSAGYNPDENDARERTFLAEFEKAREYINSGALGSLGVSQVGSPPALFGFSVGGLTNSGQHQRPIFTRTSFGNNPTAESGDGEP